MNRHLASLCVLCVLCGESSSAPPNVTHLFPAGLQRGTTAEVTAGGTFDTWPPKVWVSDPHVAAPPATEKGKFSLIAAPDAAPGVYWLRAYDASGAGPLRPFVVGTLPEISEKEPNDEAGRPQAVKGPAVVVNGALAKPGDVDCFAVTLKKGQTLVASVLADRVLKSPMDAVLQIVSPDGFVQEQNHDHAGLDPQVMFTAPADGTFVVRLFAFTSVPNTNISLGGGDLFVYRLTLTTAGFADFARPLAVPRDEPPAVAVAGWNVPSAAAKLDVSAGNEFATLGHPLLANTIRVRLEPHPTFDLASTPPPAAAVPPFSVSGVVEKPGAANTFTIAAKKGKPLSFQAYSPSFGLPLAPVVRVTDADGKQLVRGEPTQPGTEPTVAFAPPADGTYTVEVRDLYGDGSPRHAYLLRVLTAEPDYELTVAADRFTVVPGKPTDIPVKVTRRGYTKDVAVTVEGLAEGITAELVPPTGKPDPATVTLRLTAEKPGVGGPVRVVGTVAGEPKLTRTATALLADLGEKTADLWVSSAATAPPPPPPKKKK